MAAATGVSLFADSVSGDLRVRKATMNLAATGDTYQVPDASQIFIVDIIPPTNVVITPTVSGNTITFNYTGGGGQTAMLVTVTFI